MEQQKAQELNNELVKVNPEYNGAGRAIGFELNDEGDYIITYTKGEVYKTVATIPSDIFKAVSVGYLAHMYESKVEMVH